MQTEFISTIHGVSAAQWNGLSDSDYPFIRHEFFAALEDSRSTAAASGWQPQHLLVRDGEQLLAALPLFIKNHSYGEYVFDWAWADAFQRYGSEYYPKLLSAIPFTPCYGTRLLRDNCVALEQVLPVVLQALQERAKALGASSWHCLFPTAELSEYLTAGGIPARLGSQFHWFNHGYHSFADFLARMASRKRKNIAKERRQVAQQGFTFNIKHGREISPADWEFFAGVYRLTYLKRSGHAGYLTPSFFQLLGERLPEHTLLVLAERAGEPVAAALYLRDSTTLYGRYWGCREEFDFLHFETCYYQGIDYAIAQGLQRFDGGAQGEHKIQRGFEPIETWSNHWIAQPEFAQAIGKFLGEEKRGVLHYIDDARRYLPFKDGSGDPAD